VDEGNLKEQRLAPSDEHVNLVDLNGVKTTVDRQVDLVCLLWKYVGSAQSNTFKQAPPSDAPGWPNKSILVKSLKTIEEVEKAMVMQERCQPLTSSIGMRGKSENQR
jgi:hypothetical protein